MRKGCSPSSRWNGSLVAASGDVTGSDSIILSSSNCVRQVRSKSEGGLQREYDWIRRSSFSWRSTNSLPAEAASTVSSRNPMRSKS